MNFKNVLFLFLAVILLQACAPTGPVKFYEGMTRPAGQIARVKVPGPITALEIDGRKIHSPFTEEGFYELHLPPGAHRLIFKYELYWGSADSGMIIKSDPIEFNHNFAAGKVYELVYKKPASEDEAYTMANDFQATLVDADGSTRVVSRSLDERTVAPASFSEPATTKTPVANLMPSAEQAVNEDAVKHLKFWWLMTDEAERDEFRKWIQQEAYKEE